MARLLKQAFATSIFLYCCTVASGQQGFTYAPLKDDSLKLLAAKRLLTKQYETDSALLKDENKKYIVDIYRDRYNSIKQLFDDKEITVSPEGEGYLNYIISEVISKNPDIKKVSPRFFFSRAYWPNAYSTGEGTIVFNMQLFSKLENESQAAFVICHELAHLYLDHSNKKIYKYISTVYSDEMQKKLKSLKKQEYDKNAELDKLELNFAFKHFRHSRDSEREADSAGLVFMKNTGYDCREALTCLAVLDSIDEEKIDIDKALMKIFSFAEYPFKSRWLKKEETFFGGVNLDKKEKTIEDSLKTHPDCMERIKVLTSAVEKMQSSPGKKFLQDENKFKTLQHLFAFEVMNYCFNSKKISRCLFNSIGLLEKFPGNPYLVTITGQCLNEMYSKQRDHTLNSIAESPSPYREKKYNTLLEFISRLSLLDIGSLSYSFLKQNGAGVTGNTAFEKAFEASRKNLQDFKN